MNVLPAFARQAIPVTTVAVMQLATAIVGTTFAQSPSYQSPAYQSPAYQSPSYGYSYQQQSSTRYQPSPHAHRGVRNHNQNMLRGKFQLPLDALLAANSPAELAQLAATSHANHPAAPTGGRFMPEVAPAAEPAGSATLVDDSDPGDPFVDDPLPGVDDAGTQPLSTKGAAGSMTGGQVAGALGKVLGSLLPKPSSAVTDMIPSGGQGLPSQGLPGQGPPDAGGDFGGDDFGADAFGDEPTAGPAFDEPIGDESANDESANDDGGDPFGSEPTDEDPFALPADGAADEAADPTTESSESDTADDDLFDF